MIIFQIISILRDNLKVKGFLLIGIFILVHIASYANESESNYILGYDYFQDVDTNRQQVIPYALLQDYILKPGDEVNVNMWGALNLHYTLSIDNDGYITIPEAGHIALNGLTFAEAKKRIINALSKTYAYYIDVTNPGAGKAPVDISMGKTAGVHVFVTGFVKKPGDVSFRSMDSSIINVIKQAGGTTELGSVRNIKLRKTNGMELTFDLYDFLVRGVLQDEFKYLSDGDIVYVPVLGRKVSITGAVKRAGVYELGANDKLKDLIEFAGGLQPDASQNMKIERAAGSKSLPADIIMTSSNIELCDGDVIRILDINNSSKMKEGDVHILGEVYFPGRYQYINGMKVLDLLKLSNGLSEIAYTKGATLTRDGKLNIIELDKAIDDPSSKYNFIIYPNDRINIPKENNFVYISGAVQRPSNVVYSEGKTAAYYIEMAGGYKENADRNSVKMIKPNGSLSDAFSSFWFFPDPVIPEGATIEVFGKN